MNNSVNVQNENNNELKKAILIGIIVSIVGSIVVILILRFLVFGVHKNTTGLSDYKAANVDLNCAYSHNTGDTDISIILILFTIIKRVINLLFIIEWLLSIKMV